MKKILLNLIMVLCIAVSVVSGSVLVKYYMDARETKSGINDLLNMKQKGTLSDGDNSGILKDYRQLYEKNHDLAGWIQIDGTAINYPVMQTPKDESYYIHRNFNKEGDSSGLPFLSANSNVEDEHANLMVYGHHMKNGLMFAQLLDFNKESYYKSHKVVNFDTLTEKRQYEIVGAFYSQVFKPSQKVFKFYNYSGNLSKKEFKQYMKNVKEKSIYNTGVEASYGEQLLTLVTCSYHVDEGRFVLVAKQKK